MTQLLPSTDLPRPAPAADAGPLDAAVLRPRRGAGPAGVRGQPGPRVATSASTTSTTCWATPAGTRSSREIAADRGAPRGGRGAGPGGAVPGGPLRARPRDPQPPPRPVPARRGPPVGAAGDRGRRARRRDLPPVRPRRRAARGAPRSTSPSGSRPRPPTSTARAPARSGPQVGIWQKVDQRYAKDLPRPVRRGARGRRGVLPDGELGTWTAAIAGATTALEDARAWLDEDARARDRRLAARPRALRRAAAAAAPSATSTPTRSCEIGWDQLRRNLEARRAAARELDPDADLRDRHRAPQVRPPGDVRRGARRLQGRRCAGRGPTSRARTSSTIPDDESIEVIATPEYLRSVMPFAAYFSPARFDDDKRGLYIVTPAVDDDPNAMREHYYGLDLEHEHPRGVPGPPPPVRRRGPASRASPGCSPTPPSSSRAGACTPSR